MFSAYQLNLVLDSVDESILTSAENLKTNAYLIDLLQTEAKAVLDPLIPIYSNVVLLDFPNNPNVGDSLIWLGEIAYLKSRCANIKYVCDSRNYNPCLLKDVLDSSTIMLIHGGGNFGTIWPEEQDFRERVLLDFPNTHCIQLPQSISFDNKSAIEKSAKIINAHSNYTILTRDKSSYEFVRREFKSKVQLCPDMAFFMGPQTKSKSPVNDYFILSRTDHEKANDWVAELKSKISGTNYQLTDWLDAGSMERVVHRIEKHTTGLRRIIDKNNLLLLVLWTYLAKLRMRRGAALLQQGKVVLTDRLHTHILSVLMDIPHIVIDNANKKISGFYNTWTKGYPRIRLVGNCDEALSSVKNMNQNYDSKSEFI